MIIKFKINKIYKKIIEFIFKFFFFNIYIFLNNFFLMIHKLINFNQFVNKYYEYDGSLSLSFDIQIL